MNKTKEALKIEQSAQETVYLCQNMSIKDNEMWSICSKEQFVEFQDDPLYRTRTLYTHPAPQPAQEQSSYKPEPAENYEGLVKQFYALVNLVNCLESEIEHYRKQDYSASTERLNALEDAIESEKDMNAKLTEELSKIEQPAQTYQHKWDKCGERCLKCGDKDWMGGACSVADEQPTQKPVAWMYQREDGAGVLNFERNFALMDKGYKETALYTHPHQWKELTREEMLHGMKDMVNAIADRFPIQQPTESALEKYNRLMDGEKETSAIERLRFFLSLALNGKDWLDVESFIKDLKNDS